MSIGVPAHHFAYPTDRGLCPSVFVIEQSLEMPSSVSFGFGDKDYVIPKQLNNSTGIGTDDRSAAREKLENSARKHRGRLLNRVDVQENTITFICFHHFVIVETPFYARLVNIRKAVGFRTFSDHAMLAIVNLEPEID